MIVEQIIGFLLALAFAICFARHGEAMFIKQEKENDR